MQNVFRVEMQQIPMNADEFTHLALYNGIETERTERIRSD